MSRFDQLWPNQQEALTFALQRPATMLDMDMGTGKTRVALEYMLEVAPRHVLVLCPKSVMPVWPREIDKHGPYPVDFRVWTAQGSRTVAKKADEIRQMLEDQPVHAHEIWVFVMNYDIVWRNEMRHAVDRINPDLIILDESHRAKAPNSKISKYLAMMGRRTRYKLCLSGTPMANSPLDIYGQYRFLDNTVFGTRYDMFREEYAILGGPERNFVVGFKNQDKLMRKFRTLAYSCKMDDIKDRLKLPDKLPHRVVEVDLPAADMKLSKQLAKEFIAEVDNGQASGTIVLKNVLHKLLRLQQITSGFAMAQDGLLEAPAPVELNAAKEEAIYELMLDMSSSARLVVFVVFKHDIRAVIRSATKAEKRVFQLSGEANQLEQWNRSGGVLVVQIQAGAEGIDLTSANTCIYYSLPTSVALYEQSMARLYRPGQTRSVLFIHLVATGTVDVDMLHSMNRKRSLFEDFMKGERNYGFLR